MARRHRAGSLCTDLMLAPFGDLDFSKDWILPLLPEDCFALQSPVFSQGMRTYVAGFDAEFVIDGNGIEAWIVSLNTAWVIGSDPVRLFARLHGQCEIHCWVDGPNREWLAGIIHEGLNTQIYQKDHGWESVIELLESRDDGPVVCSYSVCDSFPSIGLLPKDHPLSLWECEDEDIDEIYDKFYELPTEEVWSECMKALRAESHGLEMKPDNWESFRFGHNETAFSLRRTALDRLEKQKEDAKT